MVDIVEFTLLVNFSDNRVEAIRNIRAATGFGLAQSRVIYDMAASPAGAVLRMTPEQFGHMFCLLRTSRAGTSFTVENMIDVAQKIPPQPVFDAVNQRIEGELAEEPVVQLAIEQSPGLGDILAAALKRKQAERDGEAA